MTKNLYTALMFIAVLFLTAGKLYAEKECWITESIKKNEVITSIGLYPDGIETPKLSYDEIKAAPELLVYTRATQSAKIVYLDNIIYYVENGKLTGFDGYKKEKQYQADFDKTKQHLIDVCYAEIKNTDNPILKFKLIDLLEKLNEKKETFISDFVYLDLQHFCGHFLSFIL